MKLDDLNQFTILSISRGEAQCVVQGQLKMPGQIEAGSVCVWMDEERVVVGMLRIDPDAGTGELEVQNEGLHLIENVGKVFPIFDAYWIQHVRFVLDVERTWSRVVFTARDALVKPAETPGWHVSQEAKPGDEQGQGGKIVAGGWDHEHCEFCWATIGSGGSEYGYVSDGNQWVCNGCYARFVAPRDLCFVVEGADPDGNPENEKFIRVSRLTDAYDLEGLREYVRRGGETNVRNRYGWTPLMIAASRDQQSLVKLLIDVGADVNASAKHGERALAIAAQRGHLAMIELLTERGAK